jgi:hypothetical protein
VDAGDLLAGNGEHAEWVRVAEVVFAAEREVAQVTDVRDLSGLDVGQAVLVEENPLLDVGDQRPEPLSLEGAEPLARQRLDLGLEDHVRMSSRRVR